MSSTGPVAFAVGRPAGAVTLAPGSAPEHTPTHTPGHTPAHGHAGGLLRSAGRRSVLIVDREAGWIEALTAGLAPRGFAAVGARDGLDALHALDRHQPDLILLELEVPVISGFRLLYLLRQRGAAPTIPVIVLTSLSFQESQGALRSGADGFLQKPVLPEYVAQRVEQVLAGSWAS